jgi:penicillin-binding protein 1C
VPAVRTLVMVTPHRFADTLVALGLPLDQSGDYYGYSLALGSADVTLLALTNAYRALANGGVVSPTVDIVAKPSNMPRGAGAGSGAASSGARRIFSADASFIVTSVLSDNNARTRTFGFDSPLATHFYSAVKTGTSKDMRDNWTVGFTSRYTVGVWVGNADGSPMWDVSGVTGASPVWAAVVGYLHRQRTSTPPAAPAGVIRTHVTFEQALEPARDEWFLRGTQTPVIALSAGARGDEAAYSSASTLGAPAAAARSAAATTTTTATATNASTPLPAAAPRIGAPADGTLFALDPDIPPANQRIAFERANGTSAHSQWQLDGKRIGHASRVLWPPWPGRHVLELVDANGRVADSVRFEVRGATARAVSARPQSSRREAPAAATGGQASTLPAGAPLRI